MTPITGELHIDVERDTDLAGRCLSGDVDAFAELYSHYRPYLYRVCLRHLSDPHEADDAVQETFVRAWRAMSRFDGSWRVYPWLRTIARNVCIDMLRRRNRVVVSDIEEDRLEMADPIDGHLAALEARDGLSRLRVVLGDLPERNRQTLLLHEVDGLSSRQIADEQGTTVRAVETVLFRTRRMLRSAMDRPAMAVFLLAGRLSASRLGRLLRNGGAGPRIAAAALVSGGMAAGVLGVVLPGGSGSPPPLHPPVHAPVPAAAAAGGAAPAPTPAPPAGAGTTPPGTGPSAGTPGGPLRPTHGSLYTGPAAPAQKAAGNQPVHKSLLGVFVGLDPTGTAAAGAHDVQGYLGQLGQTLSGQG